MPPHLVLGRAGQAPPREHRAARRPQDGRAGRRRRPRRARRLCPRLRPRAPRPNTAGPLPACPPAPPPLPPPPSRTKWTRRVPHPVLITSALRASRRHSTLPRVPARAETSGRQRALTGAHGRCGVRAQRVGGTYSNVTASNAKADKGRASPLNSPGGGSRSSSARGGGRGRWDAPVPQLSARGINPVGAPSVFSPLVGIRHMEGT